VHSIVDERMNASKLCIGEAYNYRATGAAGPHKHDVSDLLQRGSWRRIYFYHNLPQGFGQAVYTDDQHRRAPGRTTRRQIPGVPSYAELRYRVVPLGSWRAKAGILRRTDPNHAWIDAAEVVVREEPQRRRRDV
jgi:hypothetical protein